VRRYKIFAQFVLFLFFVCTLKISGKEILQKTFDGKGLYSIVFEVNKWGRYSIQSFNEEGTSIQIWDKKNGPGMIDGLAGERNGRLDLFLEKGKYKIQTLSHTKGRSKATVKVFSFEEINEKNPKYLIPYKIHKTELLDLQQVSYWIEIDTITTLQIEAAGRNISDLELWKDGNWRVDAEILTSKSYPTQETPLVCLKMVVRVNPGLYLLTAYGGKQANWSKRSSENPLYVVWEIPKIATTGIMLDEVSSLGYNQYLVSSEVSSMLLETEKKVLLNIEVSPFNYNSPYQSVTERDSIHVKLNDPRCMLNPHSNTNPYFLVKVFGEEGQRFKLQTLEKLNSSLSVRTTGRYWLSSLHTGAPGDQLGTSGVLTRNSGLKLYDMQVDMLTNIRQFYRKFNLLGSMSLYLWVETSGRYVINPMGVEAKWKIEKYFVVKPPNYRSPKSVTGKGSVNLTRGLHKLHLYPENKGIITLNIYHISLVSMVKGLAEKIFTEEEERLYSGLPRIQFPSIPLDSDPTKSLSLLINDQSPEVAGLVLRLLPLSLEDPLPVYLSPGGTVSVPFKVRKKSRISVSDVTDKQYAFHLDNNSYTKPTMVKPGEYKLRIENTTDDNIFVYASGKILERLPDTPPKSLPTGFLDKLPEFPKVKPGKPVFFDLGREESKVYQVSVESPGIYRLETIGRLSTKITLRNRFVTNLQSASENGLGRNALLLVYLLPGEYQVSVQSTGESAGHLGLSLNANQVISGGKLELGSEERAEVPSSVGISYLFRVDNPGTYRIQSFGQEGYFRARLDDEEGWPILKPGIKADIEYNFSKGSYNLLSLPENRTSRRITVLEKIEDVPSFKGKGPHALELNQTVNSHWVEEIIDGKRKPAVFYIHIPAPIKANLSVSDKFEASLKRKDEEKILLKWSGNKEADLEIGDYEISVKSIKEQNHIDFRLAVNMDILISGQSYTVVNPRSFEVRVGKESVVEIFSQGTDDVSAKLFSSDSVLIAENDDGLFDWNFNISKYLKEGRYYLKVQPESDGSFKTLVSMKTLPDSLVSSVSSGTVKELDLKARILIFPIEKPKDANVINVSLKGKSNLGCLIGKTDSKGNIEVLAEKRGKTIELAMPVYSDGDYQLKIWSEDHLDERVSLLYESVETIEISLTNLLNGWSGKIPENSELKNLYFHVDMGSGWLGHYRVNSGNLLSEIQTASLENFPFSSEKGLYFSSLFEKLWLKVSFENKGNVEFSLSPYRLKTGEDIRISLLENTPRAFSLVPNENTISVISVNMAFGQPFAGMYTVKTGYFDPSGIPVLQGQYLSKGKCLTVDFDGIPSTIVFWNGSAEHFDEEIYAEVERKDIPISGQSVLELGQQEWTSSKAESWCYKLPGKSSYLIKVKIPLGGIAVWDDADAGREVFSTEAEVAGFDFKGSSGDLYLLDLEGKRQFVVELLEIREPLKKKLFKREKELTLESGIEKWFSKPGEITLELPKLKPVCSSISLYYEGNINNITLFSSKGVIEEKVKDGEVLWVSSEEKNKNFGGFLKIVHGIGGIKVNLVKDSKVFESKWEHSLRVFRTLGLTNPTEFYLTDKINWFSLNLAETKHISLKSKREMIGVLLKEGKIIHYFSAFEGFDWQIALTPGEYKLGLRLMDYELPGNINLIYSLKPVKNLEEDMRPTVYLAPGESSIFSFSIPTERKIGLGIKTQKEVVQAKLYDSDWNLIGEGEQQYLNLEEGLYYFVLHVPISEEAVSCTPILVGQKAPPDLPPEEVIKKIIGKR